MTDKDVIESLKAHLCDYLEGRGIKQHGKDVFRCFNPEHEDKNPSCSVGGEGDKKLFHCFSCGIGGDLFHAAHILEGLPIEGPEFYTVTVATLAKMWNIPYTPRELTETERELIDRQRAVADASNIILSQSMADWDKPEATYLNLIHSRNIKKETAIKFKIGSIQSIEWYEKSLIARGWSRGYLMSIGLIEHPDKQSKIFESGKIIITISDPTGKSIGFVSRKKEDHEGAKYVNSENSTVYEKSFVLFGLDVSKDSVFTKKGAQKAPLYIVEGYLDAVILWQEGIRNVASLGSGVLDSKLIPIIRERFNLDINHIILTFDGDKAGIGFTEKALEATRLIPGLHIGIKSLPDIPGYCDPDDLIQKSGLKAFEELEILSPFKWQIKKQKVNNEPEEKFVPAACGTIAAEPSPLVRVGMCRDLSALTNIYDLNSITEEVNHIRGENKAKLEAELGMIFDEAVKERNGSRIPVVEVLNRALAKAKEKTKDFMKRRSNISENFNQEILATRDLFKQTGKLNGYKLSRFPILEKAFDGFPDKECLMAIAGDTNVGKSSFVRELSWDLAQSNSNVVVIYMSIDDSTRDGLQAIVARECGHSREKVYKYSHQHPDVQSAVDIAWDSVLKQAKKNYIICDSSSGNTIMHLQDHIDFAKKEFSDKRIVVFLDNFHKLRINENSGMREKFYELSQQIKDISQVEDIPIVMTVELRKTESGERFRLDHIAETKKLQYDPKIVIHIHNEMHENYNTPVSWLRDNYDGQVCKMPFLECRIVKNKHTDKKIPLAYKFEPDRSILTECEASIPQNLRNNAKGKTQLPSSNYQSDGREELSLL